MYTTKSHSKNITLELCPIVWSVGVSGCLESEPPTFRRPIRILLQGWREIVLNNAWTFNPSESSGSVTCILGNEMFSLGLVKSGSQAPVHCTQLIVSRVCVTLCDLSPGFRNWCICVWLLSIPETLLPWHSRWNMGRELRGFAKF